MLKNDFSITNILSLLSIPITPIVIKSFLFAFAVFYLSRLIKNQKIKLLTLATFAVISIFYFGFMPFCFFLVFFSSIYIFGKKFLSFKEPALNLAVPFFIYIEIYIVIAFISNFTIALTLLIFFSLFVFFVQKNKNKDIFKSIKSDFLKYSKKINIIDYWIVSLAFILGSQPQSHWDAVHANLYNAKWYILNNSFKPLAESISSLFPQNAIGYYSFFYQIGTEKALQLAYLLPLFFLLLLFKDLSEKIKFSGFLNNIWYLLIFTPIVVFQASNGYYDLLVASLLVISFYLLFFQEKHNNLINLFSASLLIGFASAIKYFPLVFIFLPSISFFLAKNKIQMKLLTVTILSSVLCLFPLSIWLVRSYLTVGSPIFPFFQSIFPTPRFWSGAELTNNFMIQTTMSTTDWLKMGFIKYPFLTYFKTESFLEATRGYPGVIYMLLLPIQALIFIKVIFSIIKRIAKKIDFYYLYLLVAFFTVGIITRYYRYLWPFQLLFGIISIIYINRFILNFKYKMLFKIAFFLILIININNVIAYFRFFPIITDRFFKPNYSKAISNSYDPISFINRQVKYPEKVKVLDVSKNILPRFHTKAITYECNWYWVKGLDEFAKARKNLNYSKKLIDGFDYIITSNPIGQAENYCVDKIEKEKNLLKQVFSDQYYLIFKVNVQSTK